MNATYDELVEMLRIDREKIENLEAEAAAERERADALAAHVVSLVAAGSALAYSDSSSLCVEQWERVSADEPENSLSRRDARVAAEALRKGSYGVDKTCALVLHQMADCIESGDQWHD